MQIKEVPIIETSTLRRDLYIVTSLLLADKEMAKAEAMAARADVFYENEVRRLMLWVSVAVRGLLDLLAEQDDRFSEKHCGEYWADFEAGEKALLTFRQACNSSIHAKEILTYKAVHQESNRKIKRVYVDRMTIRGIHKNKQTRAQIDIIRFVQTADALINFIQEEDHANL